MSTSSVNSYPNNMTRVMPIIEPTYSQHIIKPPEINQTFGRIPHRLIIDSRDRKLKYLHPNEYVYELEQHYKDVISIELVQACIPFSGYVINSNNNKFAFQEASGELLCVEIQPGNYDATDLAIALENGLNDVGQSNYTVVANTNLQKFTITSDLAGGDHIFRMIFCDCGCGDSNVCEICRQRKRRDKYRDGSIGEILGFDALNLLYGRGVVISVEEITPTTAQIIFCNSVLTEDYIVGGGISFENLMGTLFMVDEIISNTELVISGTVEEIGQIGELVRSKVYGSKYQSTGVWNLEGEKYIILVIKEAEITESNNKTLCEKFAPIFFDVALGENQVLSAGRLARRGEEKYYNPPLGKLDRLSISFITHSGKLYDFNGRNHVLVFDIIELNSPGKYNTLITT